MSFTQPRTYLAIHICMRRSAVANVQAFKEVRLARKLDASEGPAVCVRYDRAQGGRRQLLHYPWSPFFDLEED